MTYRIAINEFALSGKIPPGDHSWSRFNDAFRNVEVSAAELLNAICDGHAIAAWHEGRRKHENFISAQHIGIDFDTEDSRSAVDVLSAHPFVRDYGSIIYTTPSHTPASPRARVVFLLDRCITDVQAFSAAAQFLISMFDGADEACKDASRFFYGSQNAAQVWLSDNVLPLDDLRALYWWWSKRVPHVRESVQRAHTEAQEYKPPKDFADLVDMLIDPVRQAPQGDRNNTLNRQAFLAGKDIANNRIDARDIETQLQWAALSVGLSEMEARRTIQSGIRAGRQAM